MSRRTVLALVLCCCYLTSVQAAARLVTFQITHQGKVILVAQHTDNGLIPREEVWKNLRTVTFKNEKDASPPTKDDTLEWKLTGPVLIEAKHAGTLLGKANVQDLELVRPAAGGTEWTLKPGEMSRLADVTEIITPPAGNTESPAVAPVMADAPRNELPRWFWIMGGIVIVLIIILGAKLMAEAQTNR